MASEYIDLWAPEIISDDELRELLKKECIDPVTQPYFAALAVAEAYNLPISVANRLVGYLRC